MRPGGSALVVIVTVPVASTGTVPPNADPSTLNATPPLVTGEPSDVTVAVNVTASPTSDGFRLDDRAVDVPWVSTTWVRVSELSASPAPVKVALI